MFNHVVSVYILCLFLLYKNKEPDTLISSKKSNLLAIAIVFGRDFTDPPSIRRIVSSSNTGKGARDRKDGESVEETSFATCVASLL